MTYYYSKTTRFKFDEAVSRVTQALKEEGFGILTEIDVKDTLKKNLMLTSEITGYWVPAIHLLPTRRCRRRTK